MDQLTSCRAARTCTADSRAAARGVAAPPLLPPPPHAAAGLAACRTARRCIEVKRSCVHLWRLGCGCKRAQRLALIVAQAPGPAIALQSPGNLIEMP